MAERVQVRGDRLHLDERRQALNWIEAQFTVDCGQELWLRDPRSAQRYRRRVRRYRKAVRVFELPEDLFVYIGPARNGAMMLEIGVALAGDGAADLAVVHAQIARNKFLKR